jgi:hypothetical protein
MSPSLENSEANAVHTPTHLCLAIPLCQHINKSTHTDTASHTTPPYVAYQHTACLRPSCKQRLLPPATLRTVLSPAVLYTFLIFPWALNVPLISSILISPYQYFTKHLPFYKRSLFLETSVNTPVSTHNLYPSVLQLHLVQHRTVLYYTLTYCTVPQCTVLYCCTAQYRTVQYRNILYRTVPYRTVLY